MKITILQAVMSLYGGGQMTGVAVDSGQVSLNFNSIFNSDGDMAFSEILEMLKFQNIQDTTYIVPAYQGNPIQVM